MLEKIERCLSGYCIGVLSVLFSFIERTHGIIAISVPLLATIAVHLFFPVWISVTLAVLLWIPAAIGMVVIVVNSWMLCMLR